MYGQLSGLYLNEQQSYGTTFTGSLVNLPIINESLTVEIEDLREENLRANRFGEPPFHIGVHQSKGSLSFEPLPVPLGYLLRAACGQSSSAIVAAASSYSHLFQPRNADFDERAALPPFTLVAERDVGSAEAYSDMLVDELRLEARHSQRIKATVTLGGGGLSAGAAIPTAASPPGVPWPWDVTSASFGATAMEELRAFTVGHKVSVKPVFTLTTSKTAQRVKRDGFVEVRGSGTLLLTNSVMSRMTTDFRAKTRRQFLVNFQGVSSGGRLRVDVPQMFLESWEPRISGAELLEVDFNFIGEYDATSSYAIEYTLVNTLSAYGPGLP